MTVFFSFREPWQKRQNPPAKDFLFIFNLLFLIFIFIFYFLFLFLIFNYYNILFINDVLF